MLLVLDQGAYPSPEDKVIASTIRELPCIVVLTKADLDARYPRAAAQDLACSAPLCMVSALSCEGIDELRLTLSQVLQTMTGEDEDDPILGNIRHVEALRQAADHIANARTPLDSSYPLDMVSIDLRAAIDALGEVTGSTVTETLLDGIFSTFCLGK